MTKTQMAAARRLEQALYACKKAGLMGGVYDGTFCLWPEDAPHPADAEGGRFFQAVDQYGVALNCVSSCMRLDGGAGV
jgi:hypothetical protein